MRIEVTAEDIANGRHTCKDCPAAIAIRRQTGKTVLVSSSRIERDDGGRMITPEAVESFVVAFDRAGRDAVSPFSFEIPDDFLEATT